MFVPIDWMPSPPIEPLTLAASERLRAIRNEVVQMPCATYVRGTKHDCARCRALALIDAELAR
jgi:hypothetical protein